LQGKNADEIKVYTCEIARRFPFVPLLKFFFSGDFPGDEKNASYKVLMPDYR
jgi:hypothetical protein